MANASKDNNGISVLLGTLDSDGETPTKVVLNTTSHAVMIDDNSTGSDNGGTDAPRDENRVPVMMGVSSADGVTPVPIYSNSSGELLVDSN